MTLIAPFTSLGPPPLPARRQALRVALVNMPFSSSRFPSMQIGLLRSILAMRGISATAQYLNLEFAARIGWNLYEALSNSTLYFVGDWMFAGEAFREEAPDPLLFLKRYAGQLSKKRLEWFWRPAQGGRARVSRILPGVGAVASIRRCRVQLGLCAERCGAGPRAPAEGAPSTFDHGIRRRQFRGRDGAGVRPRRAMDRLCGARRGR